MIVKKKMKIALFILFITISVLALTTEPKIPYNESDYKINGWVAGLNNKIN